LSSFLQKQESNYLSGLLDSGSPLRYGRNDDAGASLMLFRNLVVATLAGDGA